MKTLKMVCRLLIAATLFSSNICLAQAGSPEAAKAEVTAVLAAARAAEETAGSSAWSRVQHAQTPDEAKQAARDYCKTGGLAWNTVTCPYYHRNYRADIAADMCQKLLADWLLRCDQ